MKYNYSIVVLGSEQCSQSSVIPCSSGAMNVFNKTDLKLHRSVLISYLCIHSFPEDKVSCYYFTKHLE